VYDHALDAVAIIGPGPPDSAAGYSDERTAWSIAAMRISTIPLLQTSVPDWLALAVVIASITLAVVTLSLMLLRLRPAPDGEPNHASGIVRDPVDPVLLLSAACVIALACAAWLLR
jgi:hypothetical protein